MSRYQTWFSWNITNPTPFCSSTSPWFQHHHGLCYCSAYSKYSLQSCNWFFWLQRGSKKVSVIQTILAVPAWVCRELNTVNFLLFSEDAEITHISLLKCQYFPAFQSMKEMETYSCHFGLVFRETLQSWKERGLRLPSIKEFSFAAVWQMLP